MDRFSRLSKEKRILWSMLTVSVIGGFLFATYQARVHSKQNSPNATVWRAILSANPAFSFSLPSNARQTVERDRNRFSSEGANQNFYTVTVVTYPTKTATVDVVKIELEKLVGARSQNQLFETETTSLGGREATTFLIQDFDSGWYTRGYIVEDDDVVYTLAALYPQSVFDATSYEKFIESFTLGKVEL